jgi:arsenite-activated ATPase ArsA
MPEFTLYGGKGGVGKTTCASATALADARRGERTLVVSTDPAHSVGDRFETTVGATPTSVHDTHPLYAAEIDPQQRLDDNYTDTIDALTNEIENLGVDIGDTFGIDAGDVIGSDELAVVMRSVSTLVMRRGSHCFDTAPTGHTLKLLQLPDILDSTFGKALQVKSQVESVTNTVSGFFSGGNDDRERGLSDIDVDSTKSRIERVATVLQNPDQTRFRVVMEPERLSRLETERLLERLESASVHVDQIVVNKVLTDIDSSCTLCSTRRESQQKVLQRTQEQFDQPVTTIPLIAGHDGYEVLEIVAEHLDHTDT